MHRQPFLKYNIDKWCNFGGNVLTEMMRKTQEHLLQFRESSMIFIQKKWKVLV